MHEAVGCEYDGFVIHGRINLLQTNVTGTKCNEKPNALRESSRRRSP
jgi:hypothetical protein